MSTTPEDTSSTTGDQAASAEERARAAVGAAAEQGRHVAGTAKDEAQTVAAEAATQARGVVSDAMGRIGGRSTEQKDRLADALQSVGDDLESMAAQAPGVASGVALQVAGQVRGIASHLEDREPVELLDEVRSFARQRPGLFLLGALAAGVVAGRVLRGTADGIAAATPTSAAERSPAPVAARTSREPTGFAGTGTLITTGSIGGYGLNQPEADDLLATPATGARTGSATSPTAGGDDHAEDFLR